jgi:hypothetical protein
MVAESWRAAMRPLHTAQGIGVLAVALIVSSALPSSTAAQNDRAPGWIADSRTGCKVWNPAPQARETIHWSGRCKGGYAQGRGTLQWFENGKPGDRYDGEYEAGKRSGHGVVVERNGTRIEGDWRNDELLQLGVNEI